MLLCRPRGLWRQHRPDDTIVLTDVPTRRPTITRSGGARTEVDPRREAGFGLRSRGQADGRAGVTVDSRHPWHEVTAHLSAFGNGPKSGRRSPVRERVRIASVTASQRAIFEVGRRLETARTDRRGEQRFEVGLLTLQRTLPAVQHPDLVPRRGGCTLESIDVLETGRMREQHRCGDPDISHPDHTDAADRATPHELVLQG